MVQPLRRMRRRAAHFFTSEPAAGITLMLAAVLGVWAANSQMAGRYFAALHAHVAGLSVLEWVNDALMAVFFLYVGLEVKREFLQGELDSWPRRILPGVAALAGLAAPALIYLAFNPRLPERSGWAIPAATDIAFALGVLALLGKRAPASLKIFLTALAIMDDLAAIVIIALFYTQTLHVAYLVGAVLVLLALLMVKRREESRHWPYVVLGLALWWLVLKSGIHATLAGVALALMIPLNTQDSVQTPLLERWEHGLSNWVAFGIVPIFGFVNAGVSFAQFDAAQLLNPIVLGVGMGLFVGKQIGVLGSVWLGHRLGVMQKPEASWLQIYGVAILCGIGFTMSLFIGMLAFNEPQWQNLSKIGVFLGSVLSALTGLGVLWYAGRRHS